VRNYEQTLVENTIKKTVKLSEEYLWPEDIYAGMLWVFA
jgi:hypothetical protein